MSHSLSSLFARLRAAPDAADVSTQYLSAVHRYVERNGLLPLTIESLTRYVLLDMPTEAISALLAAYDVKLDASMFVADDLATAVDAPAIRQEIAQVVVRAHLTIEAAGKPGRVIDPAEVLVQLASHPRSKPILERLGLTRLRITYFLSHGRALPQNSNEEIFDLRKSSGDVYIRFKNDNYTPMEAVTQVLTQFFQQSPAQAQEAMLAVHRDGEAFLGPFEYADARERIAKAIAVMRAAGEPLMMCLASQSMFDLSGVWREARHTLLRRRSARQGRPVGFVRKHWRGANSLPVSFWVVGIVGTPTLLFACDALFSKASLHLDQGVLKYAILAIILTVAVGTVWQWTGIWRSAARYQLNRKRTYAGRLAQAFMAVLAVAVIAFGVSTLPHANGVGRLFADDSGVPRFQVSIEHGATVVFNGGFRPGAARAMALALDANPDIRIVRLESPGGLSREGKLMGEVIDEHGLATYVTGTCASACTLAYVGGRHRYLGPRGTLLFHRSRFGLKDEAPESAYVSSFTLRKAGIDGSFIERVAETPSTSVWAPTHDELLEAGVVHQIGVPTVTQRSSK